MDREIVDYYEYSGGSMGDLIKEYGVDFKNDFTIDELKELEKGVVNYLNNENCNNNECFYDIDLKKVIIRIKGQDEACYFLDCLGPYL